MIKRICAGLLTVVLISQVPLFVLASESSETIVQSFTEAVIEEDLFELQDELEDMVKGEIASENGEEVPVLEVGEIEEEAVVEKSAKDSQEAEAETEEISMRAEGDVEINETNFPDENFRQFVMKRYGDGGTILTDSKRKNVTQILCDRQGIKNLKGIEYFTSLQYLYCSYNELSSLVVSDCAGLESLRCDNNKLSSLDVSGYASLWLLSCTNNELSSLDVSGCASLKTFRCSYNELSSLDVSGCASLETLKCDDNELSNLDVSGCASMWLLRCTNNKLSCLDVSNCSAGVYLDSFGNQLSIDGKLIDVLKYDNKFKADKVSNLKGLELSGNIFTLTGTEGTYDYDCGWDRTMTVTIKTKGNVSPSDPEQPEAPFDPEQPKDPSDPEQPEAPSDPEIPGNIFSDVPTLPGNWKYDNIKFISERGIMGGVGGSNQFQPDEPLTRAMFATVLYRMAGEPDVEYTDKFTDVPDGQWYSDAILWANQNGIVSGYSDGSGRYGINDNITREQIAKMLHIYGEVMGYDVSGKASMEHFTDKESVSAWAVEHIQWSVYAGMISGKPNDTEGGSYRIDPKGEATRAECAKMLTMFLKKYE